MIIYLKKTKNSGFLLSVNEYDICLERPNKFSFKSQLVSNKYIYYMLNKYYYGECLMPTVEQLRIFRRVFLMLLKLSFVIAVM